MTTYKKGDLVRCLGNADNQFTKGKIYTVSRDCPTYEWDSVSVVEDDSGSRQNGWVPRMFEPAFVDFEYTPTQEGDREDDI